MTLIMSFPNYVCNHKRSVGNTSVDWSLMKGGSEMSTWKQNYASETLKEARWTTLIENYSIQYFQCSSLQHLQTVTWSICTLTLFKYKRKRLWFSGMFLAALIFFFFLLFNLFTILISSNLLYCSAMKLHK